LKDKIEEFKKTVNTFQRLYKESVEEFSLKLSEMQEEIILGFLAKYNIQPDQIRLCYQGNNFWVEKKDNIDYQEKYRELADYLKIVLCDMPIDRVCDPVFMGIEKKLESLGENMEGLFT